MSDIHYEGHVHSGCEERPIREAFSCPRCGQFVGKEPHGVGYCEPESPTASPPREWKPGDGYPLPPMEDSAYPSDAQPLPAIESAATTESRRWWWFTDERGLRRRPTWWFMLRFRWIAWRENRRDEHPEDETIRAWATYDAGAQDVGRALYVAETMIHLAILEGSDPREAVSKHLNDVRDRFAIPYAKDEVGRV